MTQTKGYVSHIPDSVLDKLPVMVKTEIVKMLPEKQGMFLEEFCRKRKSMGLAYFLWFIIGFHYIYLGKVGWQFFYWFTLGGLLIWTIVDLFRIPGMVRGYNRDVATDVLRDLKIISG